MNKVIPTIWSDLLRQFESWQKIIKMNDVGHVVFPCHNDRNYRLLQFKEWCQKNGMDIEFISLKQEDICDRMDLGRRITESKSKNIAIVDSEYLLYPDRVNLWNYLGNVAINKLDSLIFFWEYGGVDVFDELIKLKVAQNLIKNKAIVPYYEKSTVDLFCDYYESWWEMKPIGRLDREKIYDYCGGYAWVMAEIVRQIALQNASFDKIIDTEIINYKGNTYFNSLSEGIKNALYELRIGNLPDEKHLQYFRKLRLFDPEKNKSLPGFLLKAMEQANKDKLKIEGKKIILNNTDISNYFSQKEIEIMTREGVLDKEMVAEILWGDEWEESYSEWAISQYISRLRTKLKKHKLSIKIKTIRNKGYEVEI